jgi:hypothetical protein
LRARDSLARILQAVEEKENSIYDQAEELGVERLKRHGTSSLMDYIGFSHGDPSFVNLAIVQASAEKDERLKVFADKLSSYIGIKARYY